jgi:valyl-tRNA synthetase
VRCFDQVLRLLHPFMPFISEELWQAFRPFLSESNLSEHLAVAHWPKRMEQDSLSTTEAEAMERCIAATQAVNSLRSLVGHHPGQRVNTFLSFNATDGDIEAWKPYAMALGKIANLEIRASETRRPPGVVFASVGWADVGVQAPAGFDFDKARGVLGKKLDEVRVHLNRNKNRFENPEFRAKADADTVADIAEKLEQLKAQETMLEGQLRQLS